MNPAEKYITFQELPPLAKTRRWYILDKGGQPFALIKWYGGWRKYVCYFSESYCDHHCLKLIQEFLEKVNKQHHETKKKSA